MKSFPEIKTKNILLRQISDSDIDKIFEGLSHPSVIEYYGVNFKTIEDTKEQMQWYKNLQQKALGIWWALCSADNEIFYGAAGLSDLSSEHAKAEIGFWLLPQFWGKGLMQEALPLVLNYGFNTYNLHRIEAFVENKNKSSKGLLQKLGFTYEGTMRECEIKAKQFISLDIYAKIKKE